MDRHSIDWIDRWTNRKDRRMGRQQDRWTEVQTDMIVGWVDRRMDEQKDRWTDR